LPIIAAEKLHTHKPAAASAFACALAKLLDTGAAAAASSTAGSAAAFFSLTCMQFEQKKYMNFRQGTRERTSLSSGGSVQVVTFVLVL
jgi:hypothetical protein